LDNLSDYLAHYPSTGFTGSEGDPEEPASALQELCRTHHHENTRSPQGFS